MRPEMFPEGSGVSNSRAEVACVRMIDAHMALIRKADRVIAALDDMTAPGVVRAPADEEDSLVIALRDAVSASNPADPGDDSTKKP